jgi:ATP-binding cassette subfamily B protein RaxB
VALPTNGRAETTSCSGKNLGLSRSHCLAMVASFHGYGTDPANLRRKHSISLKGSTLARLIQIGSQIKLASRPVKLELTDLDKLRLPAILHWDFNHFVVLTGGLEPFGSRAGPGAGNAQVKFPKFPSISLASHWKLRLPRTLRPSAKGSSSRGLLAGAARDIVANAA